MNVLNLTKFAADIIVSTGVGSIVGNAIKATTPTDVKIYQKISIAVGSVVLSGFAAARASDYVSTQISTVAEQVKNVKNLRNRKNTDI